MAIVVKKFGGTSVGDLDRIRNVARIVADHIKNSGDQVVVVVSAMAGETNRLVKLAKSLVTKPEPRELDVLLATGEQVTTALLSMQLVEMGIKAKSLSAAQVRIETDRHHTRAQIQDIDETRLHELLSRGEIPVVAGFQGIDAFGDVTTLGRGGSDITAVAVAAALKAKTCYIYTDVKGVYSTDPRICPDARLLERVGHEEMLELASLGAKVLHARSVYFAMAYEVPLCVLSAFEAGPGTWIVKEEELVEKPIVTGITYRNDEAKITVSKLPDKIEGFGKLFKALAEHEIFVDMITQTGIDSKTTDISFTVVDESSAEALELCRTLVPKLGAQGVSLERNIAKVSVVGVGMKYHAGVAAKLFEALAEEDIPVEMISTSEIKISIVIPMKYVEVAVRTLHEKFQLQNATISEEKDPLKPKV